MKAKLIKKDGHYFLEVEPNTWTPPNRFHSIIANTLEKTKGDVLQLSLKNCQAIENGYDLDELVSQKYLIENTGTMFMPNTNEVNNVFRQEGFKAGFQKALELMGDKKFSEQDVRNAYFNGEKDSYVKGGQTKDMENEFIQSLQQTEWDVEIEMFTSKNLKSVSNDWGKLGNPNLDENGCLILKRV